MTDKRGEYSPVFDIMEAPDLFLGELVLRERHPDGTPIPEEELETMADKMVADLPLADAYIVFRDVLDDEKRMKAEQDKGE